MDLQVSSLSLMLFSVRLSPELLLLAQLKKQGAWQVNKQNYITGCVMHMEVGRYKSIHAQLATFKICKEYDQIFTIKTFNIIKK